jgi:hypothetical protein
VPSRRTILSPDPDRIDYVMAGLLVRYCSSYEFSHPHMASPSAGSTKANVDCRSKLRFVRNR